MLRPRDEKPPDTHRWASVKACERGCLRQEWQRAWKSALSPQLSAPHFNPSLLARQLAGQERDRVDLGCTKSGPHGVTAASAGGPRLALGGLGDTNERGGEGARRGCAAGA